MTKRSYSNGDRLRQAHLDAYPEEKAPVSTLICICLVVLAVLGATAWGWTLVNVYIADQVNVGITLD